MNASNSIKVNFKNIELTYDEATVSNFGKGVENLYRGEFGNEKVVVKILTNDEKNKFKASIDRRTGDFKDYRHIRNVLYKKDFLDLDDETLFIFEDFEYTLHSLTENKKEDDHINLKVILLTATDGLMHFHALRREGFDGMVHRNLEPKNIVIQKINGNDFVGKISDLWLSKFVDNNKDMTITTGHPYDTYSAPELINCINENVKLTVYKKEVDVFSMGLIYFFALTDDLHLFGEDKSNILNGTYIRNYAGINVTEKLRPWERILAQQLIMSMTKHEPKERPSVRYILNHPFFWNDYKIETFLSRVSQYVNGKTILQRTEIFEKIEKEYKDWPNRLIIGTTNTYFKEQAEAANKENIKKYKKRNVDIPEFAMLLLFIRNSAAHINEYKNEQNRNHLKSYDNIISYFLKKFPKILYHCFNLMMIDHSKFLREFYCDCYLKSQYDTHKCQNDDNIEYYKWEVLDLEE